MLLPHISTWPCCCYLTFLLGQAATTIHCSCIYAWFFYLFLTSQRGRNNMYRWRSFTYKSTYSSLWVLFKNWTECCYTGLIFDFHLVLNSNWLLLYLLSYRSKSFDIINTDGYCRFGELRLVTTTSQYLGHLIWNVVKWYSFVLCVIFVALLRLVYSHIHV